MIGKIFRIEDLCCWVNGVRLQLERGELIYVESYEFDLESRTAILNVHLTDGSRGRVLPGAGFLPGTKEIG